MKRLPLTAIIFCLIYCGLLSHPAVVYCSDQKIDFRTDIAPILTEHCIRCHSPNIKKGDVSLDTMADLRNSGFVVAGDAESSYLIDLVTAAEGEKPAMPAEGTPLSSEEVAALRAWINAGASWPDDVVIVEKSKADASWWSLQPLQAGSIPTVENLPENWKQNPIDQFLYAEMQEKQLQPNPPASRRVLIRRATYDLTGLPPTPEEVKAFEENDDPNAYAQLIDRLLASPHYGERWGRHWLDVIRFGESIGYERNVIVNNLWPFRDYVIRSLNEDKPFDQFIREHIAGDVMGDGDPDQAIGTAFLVAGPYDDVGNQDAAQAAQIRANTLDEIIGATGQAFLGMTVACARCHNHKFDPITQADYYSLYATFSGIRHGAVPLGTAEAMAERNEQLQPLQARAAEIAAQLAKIDQQVLARGKEKLAEYEARWTREPVQRTGTEETFAPVEAKFVRLMSLANDINPNHAGGLRVDEFEVWSAAETPVNVALAANGGKASGAARQNDQFPNAYAASLAIDGKFGARYISQGRDLTIELAEPTQINRVYFSSARDETAPAQRKFSFVADYEIQISLDGKNWQNVADGWDRQPTPINPEAHRNWRLMREEITPDEVARKAELNKQRAEVNQQIAAVPAVPSVWIGTRNPQEAKGPFHIFLGGSPQKKGEEIVPASLSAVQQSRVSYELPADASEGERREELAEWITDPENPLTPRVLANRLWHYHFGTGIVNTPSDFGYMGGRPTHPELLDFLAEQLIENGWQLKAMHRLIMTSQAYQQSSRYREEAARVDGESRYLWRFPPRRLSAEEIRDTILQVSGKLNREMGGPGFRLYLFTQDNVCTYTPLDQHGPETYRRAVYHQNARASVVDLMTDFDQPDCAFTTPRRAETTTPLQALTMLNHSFTVDMASFLAERVLADAGENHESQVRRAFQLCYSRGPTPDELADSQVLIEQHDLEALCRVMLNTSELIYVE